MYFFQLKFVVVGFSLYLAKELEKILIVKGNYDWDSARFGS